MVELGVKIKKKHRQKHPDETACIYENINYIFKENKRMNYLDR